MSSRTLTGAWIETYPWSRQQTGIRVAPSRVRGLKHTTGGNLETVIGGRTLTGAWIETTKWTDKLVLGGVAPSRVRGLKLNGVSIITVLSPSHPHGCVD